MTCPSPRSRQRSALTPGRRTRCCSGRGPRFATFTEGMLMSEHRYPYLVEPDGGFADRLEDELVRRLHDPVDTTVGDRVDRSMRLPRQQEEGNQRLRRGSPAGRKRRLVNLGIAAS